MRIELEIAIQAALEAGKAIMEIYGSDDFKIELKEDDSPLTIADKKANELINEFLLPTGIPIISEENQQLSYSERKDWINCWIVDPLDGTKEFIQRNGEFTVNIALIENQRPIAGVIFAPAIGKLFFADVLDNKAYKATSKEGNTSFKNFLLQAEEIGPSISDSVIKVVASRSHLNDETKKYIEALKKSSFKEIKLVLKGSSLKFCVMAEGNAQFYPRFAPTMEWDTAAGQAICEAVGLNVSSQISGQPVLYNKKSLMNDHFLVSAGKEMDGFRHLPFKLL